MITWKTTYSIIKRFQRQYVDENPQPSLDERGQQTRADEQADETVVGDARLPTPPLKQRQRVINMTKLIS